MNFPITHSPTLTLERPHGLVLRGRDSVARWSLYLYWCLLAVWLWGKLLYFSFLLIKWNEDRNNPCLTEAVIKINWVNVCKVLSKCFVYAWAQSCLIFTTPWTIDCQVPLSMGFSRPEYWSGLPEDLPNPGIESLIFPALWTDSLLLSHQGCPYLMHDDQISMTRLKSTGCCYILKSLQYLSPPMEGVLKLGSKNGLQSVHHLPHPSWN